MLLQCFTIHCRSAVVPQERKGRALGLFAAHAERCDHTKDEVPLDLAAEELS